MHSLHRACHRQRSLHRLPRGASLLVVATLLLGVGVMGLTGFHLARSQYQLAGNLQYQELAFAKAEATLFVAEKWLSNTTNSRSAAFVTYDADKKGLYPVGKLAELARNPETMVWNDTNSIQNTAAGGRYIIEQIGRDVPMPGGSLQAGQRSSGSCRSVDLFRVVARSEGMRGATRLVEAVVATNVCT